MKRKSTIIRLLCMAAAVALLAACASIGRPEGGAKDELPPVYVKSNPAPGSLNYTDNRVDIYFDENIKLDDALNKVVVSPVQKTPPRVTANGRHLKVEFQDTLVDDATYTIDFSDAIRDLNEGNILDGFAFDFATGDTRDSLVISGMVFEAKTLEPAQGMVVGVYSNLADSAITTLPFDRITKTNQYGQFIIRNLAPGTYNLFAVNDINRDYHWDRSEDVAFYPTPITPTVETIEVTDTLRSGAGRDSIVTRQGVRYLPNDLLLTWFNEHYKSLYLKNYSRIDSTRISIEFGAKTDSLPVLTLLNGPKAGTDLSEISLLDHSQPNDSLTFWLTEKSVISQDTLLLSTRYLRTDSLNQLSWTTDTLKFINKTRQKAPEKKKNKSNKDSISADSLPQLKFIDFKISMKGGQDLNKPLHFVASEPIALIDEEGIRLETLRDTVWTSLGKQKLQLDSANRLLHYRLDYNWEPGAKYRFVADSASITGIYGDHNRPISDEFTVKLEEDYSQLTFNIAGASADDHLVVELLNGSDKLVDRVKAQNGVATFSFLEPNTYYARAFIDRNDNGVWDTGNIADKIQPEDTYYYPKKVILKKNWEVSQTWNIDELPVDRQKPNDIKKNKPKTREKQPADTEDDEDEEDDFYNPRFGGNSSFGNNGRRGGNRVPGGVQSSGTKYR